MAARVPIQCRCFLLLPTAAHARLPTRLPCGQPRRRAQAPRARAGAALHERQGQALPLRRHPCRRRRLFARRPLRAEEGRVRTAASPCCGRATTCPSRWPTTCRWCASSTRRARSSSTRARRRSRRCCCARHDQLRLFELHPTEHRILDSYLGNAARRGGQACRRLRRPEGHAAADHAPRRRADGPELRRQRRLRPRHRRLREAIAAFRRRRLRGLVPAGAASSRPRNCRAGWRRWRPRAGCMRASPWQSPTRWVSAWPAAACSSSTRPTRCTTRWPACCPGWSRCSASTTAPATCSTSARPDPAAQGFAAGCSWNLRSRAIHSVQSTGPDS